VSTADDKQLARMQRIETLIQEVEALPDARVQAVTRELVQVLLDVHGAGLARILEAVSRTGEAGRPLLDALAGDELVAGLLLLHGLDPQEPAADRQARLMPLPQVGQNRPG
jgi:hypothetical protein